MHRHSHKNDVGRNADGYIIKRQNTLQDTGLADSYVQPLMMPILDINPVDQQVAPSMVFQRASRGVQERTKVRIVAMIKATVKPIMPLRNHFVFLPCTNLFKKNAMEILTKLMPVLLMGDGMKAQ